MFHRLTHWASVLGWSRQRIVGPALLAVLILSGLQWTAAQAAPRSQTVETPVLADSSAQPIDVVVLLDDSGSMATCWPWPQDAPPFAPPCGGASPNLPSDPDELRYSAARLLLQLADNQDRVAVVRFDSTAAAVGDLGTLQPVGDLDNRTRLSASLQPPADYFLRGYTRIDLGLDEAIRILTENRVAGRSQYVLLLTDGEPSQQAGVSDQRPRIGEQLQQLAADDVLVVPVVLCNPSAGCSDDFLREQFSESQLKEAKTASELLRVFTEIVTDMKPDRSILTGRDSTGALNLQIRTGHGAHRLAFVTPRGGLLSVKQDGNPILPQRVLEDPNIDMNLVTADQIGPGAWTGNTTDLSGFAVVQAESYPLLLNPPPSLADSPASVRYYPAGSIPLLIAQGVGPGAGEPLYYNGEVLMAPFGRRDLRALVPAEAPNIVQLQLGDDSSPLQLIRTFQLQARSDLPRVEVFSPLPGADGLQEDGSLLLQAGFGGGATADDIAGTVYIFDESLDENGNGRLVHEQTMQCADRLCTDNSFTPVDGREYRVAFVVEAQSGDIRFSDWIQQSVELAPAVYLRGLPAQLDLSQMPVGGWPIELASSTLEEIGALEAVITLRDAESGDVIPGVTLNFNEEVPEDGAVQTTLNVLGLDSLRPGAYQGAIGLKATSPAGLPMTVAIRPDAVVPVTLSVSRPQARIDSQLADFGAVQFDTSPNFRLNQEVLVPVAFTGAPFPIVTTMDATSCPALTVATGEVQQRGGQFFLPLALTSAAPVPPGTCTGRLTFAGPDGDYDIVPGSIDWQSRVDAVEWALVGGDLDFDDLQDAGSRAEGTVLVRFNGKRPFIVQVTDLSFSGTTAEGPVQLNSDVVEAPAVEVNWEPNEAGIYEVPITLIARADLPHDAVRGTFYAGTINMGIAGLDETQSAGISFRSPSLYQRYVQPVVQPIYSMPQALCTIPLTLLLLLVLVARFRGRNIHVDELEEAAMASAMHMTPAAPPPTAQEWSNQAFTPVNPAATGAVWGRSEWGSPWGAAPENDAAGASSATARRDNAGRDEADGNPWESSW